MRDRATGATETAEYQLVTHCVDVVWDRICAEYSEDAVEHMRWSMSKQAMRTIAAGVLNGAEVAGYRIVAVMDLRIIAESPDVPAHLRKFAQSLIDG